MTWRKDHRRTADWLSAEGRLAEDEADRQFAALMGSMPRLRVPAGFSARVLLAAGVRPEPVASWTASWSARLLFGVSFALGGLALLTLPGWTVVVSSPKYLVWMTAFGAQLGVWLGDGVRHVLSLLAVFIDIGEALQLATRTTPVMIVLAASASLALGSLLALGRLLVPREESLQC